MRPFPAETAMTPLSNPRTSTGPLLSVVVPFPSSPEPLAPQHLTPPGVSAQLCPKPAEIARIPSPSPLTSTGTGLSVVVPFPSSVPLFQPQHLTPPASVSAQVCAKPEEMALTPTPSRPTTATGVLLSTIALLPSLAHLAVAPATDLPLSTRAQAWLHPTATAVIADGDGGTGVGGADVTASGVAGGEEGVGELVGCAVGAIGVAAGSGVAVDEGAAAGDGLAAVEHDAKSAATTMAVARDRAGALWRRIRARFPGRRSPKRGELRGPPCRPR